MAWPFSLEIKVRFRDLDAMGHVNNAVYFTYLEQARTDYYMKLAEKSKISDLGFIVASAKCDYKSAASIEDSIVVYVKPAKIGKTSWAFRYEMRDQKTDRLVAEAETIQVAYNYKRKKKKRMSHELKQRLLEDIALSEKKEA
ncbi:acyl-CoA thioesterase [Candidatus Woesearchaeota archaeon]|nr:acyl-CoA thioesterase [Candidatus Woesearchaeota archaeon]